MKKDLDLLHIIVEILATIIFIIGLFTKEYHFCYIALLLQINSSLNRINSKLGDKHEK